jgi:hypothetical protein
LPSIDSSDDPDAYPKPRILHFDHYDNVQPFWAELNQTYKKDELCLDWKAHTLLWERYAKPRGHQLDIAVAVRGTAVRGIFVLTRSDNDIYGTVPWSIADDSVIAREYFCPPDELPEILPLLPPHIADDLSCFYTPGSPAAFVSKPGGVVALHESQAAYFASLKKSTRQNFGNNWRRNLDLRVEPDDRVRTQEIQGLLDLHLQYWATRCGGAETDYFAYSKQKILCDLALLGRAEEMGKLVALYMYQNDTLVAVNFSVRREHNRVDDYLCLRDGRGDLSQRGLGIYAILRNMEVCRAQGVEYYDLSAGESPYKQQFKNMESRYFTFEYPALQESTPAQVAPAASASATEATATAFGG